MDFWQYEKDAIAQGHATVCGCDEAGAPFIKEEGKL